MEINIILMIQLLEMKELNKIKLKLNQYKVL